MSYLKANNQPSAIHSNVTQLPSRNSEMRYTSMSNKPVIVYVNPPRVTSKFSYGSTIERQSSFCTQLNDAHINPSSKKFQSEVEQFLPQQRQSSARFTNPSIKQQSQPKRVQIQEKQQQTEEISSNGCKNCEIM